MFGLMSKKRHDEVVERHLNNYRDLRIQERSHYERANLAEAELSDLRAFKAKVLKGLKASNEARRAKREAA